jgi:tetratricopeptide (TPR) repeat protein
MRFTSLFLRNANRRRARAYFKEASAYWRKGEQARAIDCAARAVSLDEQNSETHLALAQFRTQAGDYIGAIDGLRLAAETVYPVESILRRLVHLLYTINRPDEAVPLVRRLLEANARDHQSWLLRAQLMMALGQLDEARRAVERAIAIKPDCASGYAILSRVLLRQNEAGLAQEKVEKAIALGGESISLTYRLASIHEVRGRLAEAWDALTRVPLDHIPAQIRRARILYVRGDIDGARAATCELGRLYAKSLGDLSLNTLFNQCLDEAKRDQREPDAANWLGSHLGWPESDKAGWRLRLKWGLVANNRINQWVLAHPDRIDELEVIVETPDWSVLAAMRTEGKAILLTGGHVGPRTAVLHCLNRLDVPLGMVVGDVSYVLRYGCKPFIVPNESRSIIALREMLDTHGIIYIVVDGSFGRSRCPVEFLGASGHLAEGASALARSSGAHVFWLAARWVENRIKLDLVPGPTPDPGEDKAVWNGRFFSFYLAQLEKQLRSGPENLRHATLRFIKK